MFLNCSYGRMLCAGLRNLIMVLFAATTIRLMIENFLKYGIRINPKNWVMAVLTPEGDHMLLHALLSMPPLLAGFPSGTYCSQALHFLLHTHYSNCHTSITLAVTQAFYQLLRKCYTSSHTSITLPTSSYSSMTLAVTQAQTVKVTSIYILHGTCRL